VQGDLVFDEGRGLSSEEQGYDTTAVINEARRPVKALFEPYNCTGSSIHVNFTTSKADRWQTDSLKCHVNWVVLDSDWEAEFCRAAESHRRVIAYVKNQGLGFEVPYRHRSQNRVYLPDFMSSSTTAAPPSCASS
jgi:hypothetical protein